MYFMHSKNQNLNKFVIKYKNGDGQWTYLVNHPVLYCCRGHIICYYYNL